MTGDAELARQAAALAPAARHDPEHKDLPRGEPVQRLDVIGFRRPRSQPRLAAVALIAVLPLSVAIAVTRYRLYEHDRVISRSLLYTLLSIAVAAVYALVVLALGLVAARGPVVVALTVAPMRSVVHGSWTAGCSVDEGSRSRS